MLNNLLSWYVNSNYIKNSSTTNQRNRVYLIGKYPKAKISWNFFESFQNKTQYSLLYRSSLLLSFCYYNSKKPIPGSVFRQILSISTQNLEDRHAMYIMYKSFNNWAFKLFPSMDDFPVLALARVVKSKSWESDAAYRQSREIFSPSSTVILFRCCILCISHMWLVKLSGFSKSKIKETWKKHASLKVRFFWHQCSTKQNDELRSPYHCSASVCKRED